MAKQPVKKSSTIKSNGLSGLKAQMGMVYNPDDKKQTASNADKPLEWLTMPKAFQNATKLPGIPVGHVTSVIGHSNVGKSTLINHAIISAQRQGYIPVIFDTESSFSFKYAIDMGFKAEPIYDNVEVEHVNPETGEVSYTTEKQIVYWDGDFMYFDKPKLSELYGNIDYSTGKATTKHRSVAVIEDIAYCINELLNAQDDGKVTQGFVFVWDSVGSIISYKEYKANGMGNPMWAAAAISQSFGEIVSGRIPNSRKQTSPYSNTFIYVNKVWMDAMTNPVGPAIMQTKGGKSLRYNTRLEILLGGQLTSGTKRLTATAKGLNYSYGIETKVKILKNHMEAPYNVLYEGPMIASDLGFIDVGDLDEYKKTHISRILKQLQDSAEEKVDISENDIEFGEVEDLDME